jgi:hypothetical protein
MSAPNVPPREEINGDALLTEVHAGFGRYVVFPSAEAHDAVVLWCAATHGQPAWEHAPDIAGERCGKSRLMDIAEAICYQPLVTVNASTAAVVRSITEDPPTLMVDEADTIFGTKKAAENNEDVRGIINAGHQRNRPYVRWDITSRSREMCPTFAMVMLAAIGGLPDTIMDRAIDIRMRRRSPGEKVAPFRTRRDAPPFNSLRDQLHGWVRGNLRSLQAATPDLPVEDRAADTWEPLFAIADHAGGDWPARAREACLALTGEDPDDGRIGTKLLVDLEEIWGADEEHLFTQTILDRLHKIEEAPWSEWGRDRKPITARQLAEVLRPYRVKSKTVRQRGVDGTAMGYTKSVLADLWNRYVPRTSSNTSNTATQDDENADPTRKDARVGSVLDDDSKSNTGSDKDKQADVLDVLDVLDQVKDPHTTNGHHTPGCLVGGDSSACVNTNCTVFGLCVMTDDEPVPVP